MKINLIIIKELTISNATKANDKMPVNTCIVLEDCFRTERCQDVVHFIVAEVRTDDLAVQLHMFTLLRK